MDVRGFGSTLMVLGAIAIVGGLLLSRGWLNWFGRLPGDIRIVTDSTRIFIPITSMLITSFTLTLVVNVIRKIVN